MPIPSRTKRVAGVGQWLTLMESENENYSVSLEKKLTEISHGSIGNFSKSTSTSSRMHRPVKPKRSFCCIFFYVSLMILIISIAALLPIFWFGNFPIISKEMKKNTLLRVPVIIVVDVFLSVLAFLCLWKAWRRLVATRHRIPSVSSTSQSANIAKDPESFLSTGTALDGSNSSVFDESLRRSPHKTAYPNTSVRLRELLEELPHETVKQINSLVRDVLQPGNGKTSVVAASSAQLKQPVSGYQQEYIQGNRCHKLALKLLIVGETNVGKTSIFHRILYDMFTETYLHTVGADLGYITLYMSSKNNSDQLSVSVQIWDIAGDNRFSKSFQMYFKDAIIALTICDISNFDSLDSLRWWIQEMKSKVYDPSIALFMNKDDIKEKAVSVSDIDQMEEFTGIEKYAVSARTGENVMDAFMEVIAKTILKETKKFF